MPRKLKDVYSIRRRGGTEVMAGQGRATRRPIDYLNPLLYHEKEEGVKSKGVGGRVGAWCSNLWGEDLSLPTNTLEKSSHRKKEGKRKRGGKN